MQKTKLQNNGIKFTNQSEVSGILSLLPILIRAAYQNDLRGVDLASRKIAAYAQQKFPEVASQIGSMLDDAESPLRLASAEAMRLPSDVDSSLHLLRPEHFSTAPLAPCLGVSQQNVIDRFVRERHEALRLADVGEGPPSTLLLTGSPGTGKTMTIRWVAHQLGLTLFHVDLAAVISSYLGKTGQNLRALIDYTKQRPCVLFLDEFDALGKRRDDQSDLGELKRIVNVLLKEIELWPYRGVLAAATNHPELLDPAVWRRFDVHLELPLPAVDSRRRIFDQALRPLTVSASILDLVADATEGQSGSEIERTAREAKRRHVLEDSSVEEAILALLAAQVQEKAGKIKVLKAMTTHFRGATKRSNQWYADLLGVSEGTVRGWKRKMQS